MDTITYDEVDVNNDHDDVPAIAAGQAAPSIKPATQPSDADVAVDIAVERDRGSAAPEVYGEVAILLCGETCQCGAVEPRIVVRGPAHQIEGCGACIPGLRVRPTPQTHVERQALLNVDMAIQDDVALLRCAERTTKLRLDSTEARRLAGSGDTDSVMRTLQALVGMDVPITVVTLDGEVQSTTLNIDELAKDLTAEAAKTSTAGGEPCLCGAVVVRKAEALHHERLGRVVACALCADNLQDDVPWEQGHIIESVERIGKAVVIVVASAPHALMFEATKRPSLAVRIITRLCNTTSASIVGGWRAAEWDEYGALTYQNKPLDRLVRCLSYYASTKTEAPTTIDAATKVMQTEACLGKATLAKYAGDCRCGARIKADDPIRYHHALAVVGCSKCDKKVVQDLVASVSQQSIDNVRVPKGYEVWADGVFRVDFTKAEKSKGKRKPEEEDSVEVEYTKPPADAWKKPVPPVRRKFLAPIGPTPIWIAGRSVPLDDQNAQQLRMAFVDDGGREVVHIVPRDLIARTRTLVDLSAYGYGVHDLNAKGLLLYLAACLEENGDDLPAPLLVRRYGAFEHEGKVCWRIGEETIGPNGVIVDLVAPQANSYSTKLVRRGSPEAWLAMAKEYYAKPHSLARLAFGAAVAPVLLRPLNQRSFCVHLWGGTESSKTACWALAASVWGDQRLLVGNLNRTQISATEVFREVTDLPFVLDEKELVDPTKGIDFRRLVYELTSEQGRGRARDKGGLEWQPNWKTILLTTGEDPVAGTGQRQDLGGMSNRLVEIHVQTPIMECWFSDSFTTSFPRRFVVVALSFPRLAPGEAGGNGEAA